MYDGEIVENQELNLKSENVIDCEEAIPVMKEYKKIIKGKKKRINKDLISFLISLKKCFRRFEYVNQQYISK